MTIDQLIRDANREHIKLANTLRCFTGRPAFAYCRKIVDENGCPLALAPEGMCFIEDEEGISYSFARGGSSFQSRLAFLSRDGGKLVEVCPKAFNGTVNLERT